MIGLSVKAKHSQEVAAILDEHKMSLNGRRAAAITDRFDRAMFPLKDDVDLVLTRLLIASVRGADPKLVEHELINNTIKAAERKRPAYSSRTARTARKRFDDIFGKGKIIERPRRRGAHKGWVTRLEWNEAERLGLWTHRWRVEYVFDGSVYSIDGQAVHEDRAWRDIAKTVKTLAKSHRSSRIRLATIGKLKNKTSLSVIDRAKRAFERALK